MMPGYRAEEQIAEQQEVHVAGPEVAEPGEDRQWDRMDDVGPDKFARRHLQRIEREQHGRAKRAGADRRQRDHHA